MKNMILLSLVAATMLFTGCGEDTKKAAADAAAKTTEAVKNTASDLEKATADAMEATKKAAEATAKLAEEKAAEMKAASEKAATELKARAEATTATATELAKEVTSDDGAGKKAYAKCAGCHGKDGKTKALNKSEIIAGQAAADLEKKMAEYKAGTRNVSGMGTLMKGQVASMSDADIKAVSAYISAM
jgi:cytochrome c553